LSMIKSGLGNRNEGTRDKIAMMEAKLRQMEKSKPTQHPDAPSSLPYNASLPPKPLPSDTPLEGPSRLGRSPNEPQRQQQRKPPPPLPSLPLLPQGSAEPKGLRALSGAPKGSGATTRKAGSLVGVKLGKPKEKDNGGQKDASTPTQDDGAPSVQCANGVANVTNVM